MLIRTFMNDPMRNCLKDIHVRIQFLNYLFDRVTFWVSFVRIQIDASIIVKSLTPFFNFTILLLCNDRWFWTHCFTKFEKSEGLSLNKSMFTCTIIFLMFAAIFVFRNYLQLKGEGDKTYNNWKVSSLPHTKQQDSTSCGVFCLMVSIVYKLVWSIWKIRQPFVKRISLI